MFFLKTERRTVTNCKKMPLLMVRICLLAGSYQCIQNRKVSDLEKSRNTVISHDPLLEAAEFCILCSSTIPTEEILQKKPDYGFFQKCHSMLFGYCTKFCLYILILA